MRHEELVEQRTVPRRTSYVLATLGTTSTDTTRAGTQILFGGQEGGP